MTYVIYLKCKIFDEDTNLNCCDLDLVHFIQKQNVELD